MRARVIPAGRTSDTQTLLVVREFDTPRFYEEDEDSDVDGVDDEADDEEDDDEPDFGDDDE